MERFDTDRYYRTDDHALLLLGKPATLTRWRHEGRGPAYVRFGNRILYRGLDLNSYLDRHHVEPTADRDGQAAGAGR